MALLQVAIEQKRYDLAAHVLVYAAAEAIKNGNQHHDRKSQKKTPQLLPAHTR